MKWQPIEIAPERVDILTYAPHDAGSPIGVSRYFWSKEIRQEVESESTNRKGRRLIIQETEHRQREWLGRSLGTHPLDAAS